MNIHPKIYINFILLQANCDWEVFFWIFFSEFFSPEIMFSFFSENLTPGQLWLGGVDDKERLPRRLRWNPEGELRSDGRREGGVQVKTNQLHIFQGDPRLVWQQLAITAASKILSFKVLSIQSPPISDNLTPKLVVINYNSCKSHLSISVQIHQPEGIWEASVVARGL